MEPNAETYYGDNMKEILTPGRDTEMQAAGQKSTFCCGENETSAMMLKCGVFIDCP